MLCCIGKILAQGTIHQVELGTRENSTTLFSQGGTDHYLGGDAPNEFGPGRVIFELRCQPGSRSLAITVRSSAGNSSLPERSFEDVSYRGTSTEYALDLLLRLNSNETQPVSIILGRDDRFTFYINNSNLDAHGNVLIGFKRSETIGYNLTFKRPDATKFLEVCSLGTTSMIDAKAKADAVSDEASMSVISRAVEPQPDLENARVPRDRMLAASLGLGGIPDASFFEVLVFGSIYDSKTVHPSPSLVKQLSDSPGSKFVWRNDKQTLNYIVRSRDGKNVGLLVKVRRPIETVPDPNSPSYAQEVVQGSVCYLNLLGVFDKPAEVSRVTFSDGTHTIVNVKGHCLADVEGANPRPVGHEYIEVGKGVEVIENPLLWFDQHPDARKWFINYVTPWP
jgi:hypothetical protein